MENRTLFFKFACRKQLFTDIVNFTNYMTRLKRRQRNNEKIDNEDKEEKIEKPEETPVDDEEEDCVWGRDVGEFDGDQCGAYPDGTIVLGNKVVLK